MFLLNEIKDRENVLLSNAARLLYVQGFPAGRMSVYEINTAHFGFSKGNGYLRSIQMKALWQKYTTTEYTCQEHCRKELLFFRLRMVIAPR